MQPNIELINRVADHIERHPENHNQASYYSAMGQVDADTLVEAIRIGPMGCGTTCCVAGWAVRLASPAQVKLARQNALYYDIDLIAANLLGMDHHDAYALFMAVMTSTQNCVEILRHYANTGELKEELFNDLDELG